MAFLAALCCEPAFAENVCEAEMERAAKAHDVPLAVLYAVALTETGQRGVLQPYAMNIHGRSVVNQSLEEALATFSGALGKGETLVDIGCMQVNYRYHGRSFPNVRQMFDPQQNVAYAARFLKDLHSREATWTAAVARYHAGPGNAPAQRRYVCAVIRNMIGSGFGAWTNQAAAFCKA